MNNQERQALINELNANLKSIHKCSRHTRRERAVSAMKVCLALGKDTDNREDGVIDLCKSIVKASGYAYERIVNLAFIL
jgi:hypothetical protein